MRFNKWKRNIYNSMCRSIFKTEMCHNELTCCTKWLFENILCPFEYSVKNLTRQYALNHKQHLYEVIKRA